MVSSFEHLATSFAGVRHKSALVLVAHVAQQRALQVKNAGTHRALELGTLGRLAHGVHRVSVGQPLKPVSGRGWLQCGGLGPAVVRAGPAVAHERPAGRAWP